MASSLISEQDRADSLTNIAKVLGKLDRHGGDLDFKHGALANPVWGYKHIRDYTVIDPMALLEHRDGERKDARGGMSDKELLDLAFRLSGAPEIEAPTKEHLAIIADGYARAEMIKRDQEDAERRQAKGG